MATTQKALELAHQLTDILKKRVTLTIAESFDSDAGGPHPLISIGTGATGTESALIRIKQTDNSQAQDVLGLNDSSSPPYKAYAPHVLQFMTEAHPAASALFNADVATAAALDAYTQSGAGVGATLTANAVGVLTVDGVALVANDRVLVKDAVLAKHNGIYKVTTAGTANPTSLYTAVRLATAAALPAYTQSGTGVGATLTGNANGALSIDSTLTVAADRVLIKNGAKAEDNGIYTVTTVGTGGTPFVLTRATDFDANGEVTDAKSVNVTAGSTLIGKYYAVHVTGSVSIDVTEIYFVASDGVAWVLTRATDFDAASASEIVSGAAVLVDLGTANANKTYVLATSGTIVVDTTSLTFTAQTTTTATGLAIPNMVKVLQECFKLGIGFEWYAGPAGQTLSVSNMTSTYIQVATDSDLYWGIQANS